MSKNMQKPNHDFTLHWLHFRHLQGSSDSSDYARWPSHHGVQIAQRFHQTTDPWGTLGLRHFQRMAETNCQLMIDPGALYPISFINVTCFYLVAKGLNELSWNKHIGRLPFLKRWCSSHFIVKRTKYSVVCWCMFCCNQCAYGPVVQYQLGTFWGHLWSTWRLQQVWTSTTLHYISNSFTTYWIPVSHCCQQMMRCWLCVCDIFMKRLCHYMGCIVLDLSTHTWYVLHIHVFIAISSCIAYHKHISSNIFWIHNHSYRQACTHTHSLHQINQYSQY